MALPVELGAVALPIVLGVITLTLVLVKLLVVDPVEELEEIHNKLVVVLTLMGPELEVGDAMTGTVR
jgi:hypothetical protein